MIEVKVEEGILHCGRFGKITGLDCSCLRDTSCKGCFIFNSLPEDSLNEEVDGIPLQVLADFQNLSEVSVSTLQ